MSLRLTLLHRRPVAMPARRAGRVPPPAPGPSAEITRAYRALGLIPAAGPELAEIAYWHQLGRCRTTSVPPRERGARIEQLNRARERLAASAPADHRQAAAPKEATRAERLRGPWRFAALLPPVLAAVAAAAGWAAGLPGAATALSMGTVTFAAIPPLVLLAGHSRQDTRAPAPTPHEALCLDRTADAALAERCWLHLRRQALNAGEAARVRRIDQAYVQVCAALDERPTVEIVREV